jgi:hypothetical protein
MRVFITVLVLIFSLQSWTKADDISEFEIEGMSIGDSALDYFSEDEISKATDESAKDKIFLVKTLFTKNILSFADSSVALLISSSLK